MRVEHGRLPYPTPGNFQAFQERGEPRSDLGQRAQAYEKFGSAGGQALRPSSLPEESELRRAKKDPQRQL